MITAANGLGSLQGEGNVNNGSCNINTACNTTTGDSTTETCTGTPCNCNTECRCQTSASSTSTENGVFKTLCGIMCCNKDSGTSGCGCNTGDKNCQSISTFCKEVKSFTDLVKAVKNGTTQESTSQTTQCKCKNGNCNSCQTRRFIKLVEEYTEALKKEHKCRCVPGLLAELYVEISDRITYAYNTVTSAVSNAVNTFKSWFSSSSGNGNSTETTEKKELKTAADHILCNCCKTDHQNCLKDGYKCGISHVMKYWFASRNCKCVGVPEAKSVNKRSVETNSENADEEKHREEIKDSDKLCKCLVKVFNKFL